MRPESKVIKCSGVDGCGQLIVTRRQARKTLRLAMLRLLRLLQALQHPARVSLLQALKAANCLRFLQGLLLLWILAAHLPQRGAEETSG